MSRRRNEGVRSVWGLISRTSSRTEHRLEPEPGCDLGLRRRRAERLTALTAPPYRLLFVRSEWPVGSPRPIPGGDRSAKDQHRAVAVVLRASRQEAAPLPVVARQAWCRIAFLSNPIPAEWGNEPGGQTPYECGQSLVRPTAARPSGSGGRNRTCVSPCTLKDASLQEDVRAISRR